MIKKIEHIGIAVKDLKKSEELFEKLLGEKPYKKEEVKSEGVVTSFFKVADQKVELLYAASEDSPVSKFIKKRKNDLKNVVQKSFFLKNVFSKKRFQKNVFKTFFSNQLSKKHFTSFHFFF